MNPWHEPLIKKKVWKTFFFTLLCEFISRVYRKKKKYTCFFFHIHLLSLFLPLVELLHARIKTNRIHTEIFFNLYCSLVHQSFFKCSSRGANVSFKIIKKLCFFHDKMHWGSEFSDLFFFWFLKSSSSFLSAKNFGLLTA